MSNRNWRLPAGVGELLPPDAWALELTRRRVLDVFRTWGFEYIEPPVVEYLDALLVGSGGDMDLQTLKALDQKSGRMLGVRADMTAQAVRVDAHSRPEPGVQRLCYAGNVVFANPVSSLDDRVPLKAGAELFGSASLTADAEVIALMLEVLASVGIDKPILVLGHMGIYQQLTGSMGLGEAAQAELFAAVQSKAETDIARILSGKPQAELLIRLPGLMGERQVLAQARTVLAGSGEDVIAAIDALDELADLVLKAAPEAELRFDLAELAGYGYHNGPLFSAYHAQAGRALARGGRYDGIGGAFGRARPATGFDVNLNELAGAMTTDTSAIWAPWTEKADPDREAAIRRLRERGEVVVTALAGDDERPGRCDRILINRGGDWVVDPTT
jgi:ATP phosphoribosyltransferase regulatory subunit